MRLRVSEGGAVRLDPSSAGLTEAQLGALVTDREVAVTAGAGAGKTHTLATRYVALFLELALRGEPEIEQVAVLTFTEKAAAEMSERCYASLVALAASVRADRDALDRLDGPRGAPLGGHLATALDRLCDRFDAARIGTFHGFCAQLLREFPVETATALDSVVLEPVESAALAREALEDTLLEALSADPEGFGRLLDALGSRQRLVEAGATALARRGELEPLLQAHASGQIDVRDRVRAAPIPPEAVQTWLGSVGRPAIAALHRLTAPGGARFGREVLEPLLAELARPAPADPLEAALHANGCYARCLDALLSGPGQLRTLTHPSVLGPKRDWVDGHRYAQAKQALGVLAERCADWPDRAAVARELPTRADAALYEVLAPFSRWVLAAVDRFQRGLAALGAVDFDEMQARAVRAVTEHPAVRDALARRHRYLVVDEFQDTDARQWALIRALGRPEGRPADRIFLVGDDKQAIYGFRGGDVAVFQAASAEIPGEPVVLPHNFRSRPELIIWFNQVFPHVLEGVRYQPLLAGRAVPGGTVTAVLGEREGPGDPEATAHLIATEILAGAEPWAELGLHDRERHPAPPIAILLRRRTHMAAYEEALRARGVPYAVARGVGFWSRPEVVDLVNTLHAVATDDPESVVGALRSPLFGLTDQELADLGPRPGIARLGASLTSDRTRRAAGGMARLRQLARALPPSELVRRLVDHARPIWHDHPGLDPGRAEANGARLIELARTFDARGGIHRCATAFLGQVLAGTRESEAALEPDAARVLVLTIHAAKGLEFPVVLVPEIDVPPRGDSGALSVGRPDGGWAIAFAVADEEAELQQRIRPGLLEAVQHSAREEADAEYTRLLYVAATRARDHLVLLGNHPRDRPGVRRSWIDRLAPVLPASTRVRDRTALLEAPLPPAPPAEVAPPAPPSPVPDRARAEVELGASGLDTFVACPARWARLYQLGIPEHGRYGQERARVLAGLRGQVIHGLLEDEVADEPEVARRRWSAAVISAGFAPDEAHAAFDRLVEHLRIASTSPELASALRAPGHSEIGFRRARGPVTLRGQIDRIYRADDGWVVLDYKTEAVRGAPSIDAHRRQLLAYAWAADAILRANGQPAVVRAEVLFTATGDVVAIPWDEAARAEIEGVLDAIAATAGRSWEEVEAEAVEGPTPRPCADCGYRGRGCRGRTTAS